MIMQSDSLSEDSPLPSLLLVDASQEIPEQR